MLNQPKTQTLQFEPGFKTGSVKPDNLGRGSIPWGSTAEPKPATVNNSVCEAFSQYAKYLDGYVPAEEEQTTIFSSRSLLTEALLWQLLYTSVSPWDQVVPQWSILWRLMRSCACQHSNVCLEQVQSGTRRDVVFRCRCLSRLCARGAANFVT